MPDWSAIRIDYESGQFTQSALERKYDVSRKAIWKHALNELWVTPQVTGHRSQVTPVTNPLPAKPLPLPPPGDAIAIARIGLSQLAQHLQSDIPLEIKDHKSLSDALAQYLKILTTAPQEPEVKEGLTIPLEKLSPHTRMEIRRLLAEDAQERTG